MRACYTASRIAFDLRNERRCIVDGPPTSPAAMHFATTLSKTCLAPGQSTPAPGATTPMARNMPLSSLRTSTSRGSSEAWGVVGYFDCGGDFASSSTLSARRSGSASIRNATDYCGHRPAHASKRMPPSMISTRPGQFAFSPNPAPGLRGSRVIGSAGFIAASRGTAEDFRRLASLSRPRQIG
jgi:hypothetical protein